MQGAETGTSKVVGEWKHECTLAAQPWRATWHVSIKFNMHTLSQKVSFRGNSSCWNSHTNIKYPQMHYSHIYFMLLSHFNRVRLCVTPEMAAHQACPSLGFSRQEHWSGLPFPSPMHESEKWKGSRSVMSDPQRPHGLQPSRLLHPWDFPGKSTGVGCHCLLRTSGWLNTKPNIIC